MFGDKFYKKLRKLMPWQQTVFALALSERMYPNYCLYAESTGRGDTKLIRHALDTMWQYLTEKKYASGFVRYSGAGRSQHAGTTE